MKNNILPQNFKIFPTVFAVGDNYQIFVTTNTETVLYIKVANKKYYDAANGVLRSKVPVHIVNVPCGELDKAGEYTVVYRNVAKRDYFDVITEAEVENTFFFKAVTGEKINIYDISDSHRFRQCVINTGKYFGDDLDLLILNGDVYEGERDDFFNLLNLTSEITRGEIPVVSSRGNHDARGSYAEDYAKYNPTDNGRTYFTFKVGSIWGLVLDCGEDAADDYHEYGNCVAFREFKEKETEFIRGVVEKGEYNAKDIKHKLVISHNPLCREVPAPYNIDMDIYKEWAQLIYKNIEPELAIFGHTHVSGIHEKGGMYDLYGVQNCPCVVAGQADFSYRGSEGKYKGCAIVLSDEKPQIFFTDDTGNKC